MLIWVNFEMESMNAEHQAVARNLGMVVVCNQITNDKIMEEIKAITFRNIEAEYIKDS